MRPRLVGAVIASTALVAAGALVFLEEQRRVVVTRRTLAVGTRVTLADVAAAPAGRHEGTARTIEVERVARVIGAVVSREIAAGAPITEDDLAAP